MATYTWTLQGATPTTIDLTDVIQFAGATFNSAIFVGEYNDTTHVKSSAGANDSSGHTPKSTKFIDSTHVSLNGAASALVSSISTSNCPLKINFAHPTSVAVTNHIIYAYNGVVTTAPPEDVTFKIAEQGTSTWSTAAGSASALAVANRTAATSHDFYFLVSASPTSVGLKSNFVIRDELIYS